tara:strand:- start:690 stop:1457 length:768 start_codon:yes stop_codon:yes gene_type:complete
MPINAGLSIPELLTPLLESGAKFPLIATASSIDLISCDLQGPLMSGGDVMDSDTSVHDGSPESINSAMEYSEELADRLISRLKPEDNASILKMIANKAYFSGGLGTIILVFWWLTVDTGNDDLSTGVSTFFNLDFSQVALTVIGLGLISALLRDFSRELGKLAPALISGALIILCCLYVLEPLALGFFSDEITSSDGIWRTSRLALLWLGITYCAHLLVDASLLAWLKKFCDSKGLNIEPLNTRDDSMGSPSFED